MSTARQIGSLGEMLLDQAIRKCCVDRFAHYKTYEWVNIAGATVNDQAFDADIKRAIDAQLSAKGFTKTDQGAQLYLAYQVSYPREKQISQYIRGGYGAYGPGWDSFSVYGAFYSGPEMSLATKSTIELGNLVLDIYDSAFKDLVWRGNVSQAISVGKRKYNLGKAVAKLLKNYPPNAK